MSDLKTVDIDIAKTWHEDDSIVWVDIRDQSSFEQSHIPGAVHLNENNAEQFLMEQDKNAKVVCYCYHGISSQTASLFLAQNGFKEVYSLNGGYESWKNS